MRRDAEHAVAVQVLLETGLQRLQCRVGPWHKAVHERGICDVMAAAVGWSRPNTDRRLRASRQPHNPLAVCSTPIGCPAAKLTRHEIRAVNFQRRARTAADAIKDKTAAYLDQAGGSNCFDGRDDKTDMFRRRSGLAGNWSPAIAVQSRSLRQSRSRESICDVMAAAIGVQTEY